MVLKEIRWTLTMGVESIEPQLSSFRWGFFAILRILRISSWNIRLWPSGNQRCGKSYGKSSINGWFIEEISNGGFVIVRFDYRMVFFVRNLQNRCCGSPEFRPLGNHPHNRWMNLPAGPFGLHNWRQTGRQQAAVIDTPNKEYHGIWLCH